MEYIKKDDTTLQVTKAVEVKEEVVEYNIDYLKQQEVAILKSMNDFVAARKLELAEVQDLIAQCEKLGIQSKVEVALVAEQARVDAAGSMEPSPNEKVPA